MPSRQFIKVLYEDKDILVVDKPAGVLSEPKRDSPSFDLVQMVKGYLKRKYRGVGSYVKLLHRLDRDTSGAIVVALSKVGENLEDDFRNQRVNRQYLAVVEGAVEKAAGKIDLPLEKGEFKFGKKVRVALSPTVRCGAPWEGKRAITLFEVLERYAHATVLRVTAETGRTHQVRVHFAEIGHPLVGDKIYGTSQIPFKRQALHAQVLGFRHPRTKQKIRVEAPLPSDIKGLIDQLRESV